MAVIFIRQTISSGSSITKDIELGRAWLKRITFFPATDIDFRLINQGNNVFPVPLRGGEQYVRALDTVTIEVNKELQGPPWLLTLEAVNTGPGSQTLALIIEGYPTPYPVVKPKEPEGRSPGVENATEV